MKKGTETQHQIECLYRATAKQLYNLALYTVGDTALAEETAVSAFSDACGCIRDATDAAMFQKLCFQQLYLRGKNVRCRYECPAGGITGNLAEKLICDSEPRQLSEILICLDFEERYIVLLFCLHKYSVRQIAKITRLPNAVIEKRLLAAVDKAMQ